MKIEKIEYDSSSAFLNDILPDGKMSSKLSGFIFRGESTNTYELLPSALREKNKSRLWEGKKSSDSDLLYWQIFKEYKNLRDFYNIANYNGLKVPDNKLLRENSASDSLIELFFLQQTNYRWIPRDLEELAALAQHYGVLTRLLDWTRDIYIALYFASISAIKKEFKKENNPKDSIVIWALSASYVQYLHTTNKKLPINFVIPSYYNNPNLNAQKGVLSYWEIEMDAERFGERNLKKVDRTPLDRLIEEYNSSNNTLVLYKFEFPVSDCIEVYDYLKKMGYEASRLFPGYEGIARCIEERAIVDQLKRK